MKKNKKTSKLKSTKIYYADILDLNKINTFSFSYDFLKNEPNLYKRKSKIG